VELLVLRWFKRNENEMYGDEILDNVYSMQCNIQVMSYKTVFLVLLSLAISQNKH
jgi:hypothetical protein